MAHRSCNFVKSQGIRTTIPPVVFEECCKRMVDYAYEKNLDLSKSMYAKRFLMKTIDGELSRMDEPPMEPARITRGTKLKTLEAVNN